MRVVVRAAPGRRRGLHAGRKAQVQRPVRVVQQVGAHVSQRAGAEIDPAPPVGGVVYRVIGQVADHRPQVQIPVHAVGLRVAGIHDVRRQGQDRVLVPLLVPLRVQPLFPTPGPPDALGPSRPVGPCVHLRHVPDHARLHPLVDPPRFVAGMALVAHLGNDAGLLRNSRQHPRLVDRVRQRLLHVDVLAGLHRRLGDVRVRVIGRRHHHGVQPFFPVQHFPEVHVLPSRQELLPPPPSLLAGGAVVVGQPLLNATMHHAEVHVADGRDVLVAQLQRDLGSLAAYADDADRKALRRRLAPRAAQHPAGHDHGPHGQLGPSVHERSARQLVGHDRTPYLLSVRNPAESTPARTSARPPIPELGHGT